MADQDFPLKSYSYKGWTINFRNGQWEAVNGKGKVGIRNDDESVVKRFASTNKA